MNGGVRAARRCHESRTFPCTVESPTGRAAANAAAVAAEASDARVAAAKHMLERAIASRVEQAALRQAFAAKIRSYDEHTSSQVRY